MKKVTRPQLGVVIGTQRDDLAPVMARGLTPDLVARAFRAADSGDVRPIQELYSRIEEDPHVHSVLSKRRRAVVSRTLQIKAVESKGKQAAADKAAELCNQALFGDDSYRGLCDLHQALYDLTDAIGRAYSLLQIEWQWVESVGIWAPASLRHFPQRFTTLGQPYGNWSERDAVDGDEIRVLTQAEPINGELLEPWQWVCHRAKSRSDTLARAALLRTVVWWCCYKAWSAKEWSIFCERYGMPLRLGKYPAGGVGPGVDDNELAVLEEAVLRLGKDAGAILPMGCEIEFVQANHSGTNPYQAHAAFADTQISKAILGTTLTTEVGSTGGNRSLGEVQERAEDDMTDSDALMLASTIREQLLAPIVLFNLGDGAPLPECQFLTEEERAQKDLAERDQILVRAIGLPIAKKYFYETYEIPEPAEGEDVVSPPAKNITAGENLPEDAPEDQGQADAAKQLDEQATQEQLPNSDRRIVMSTLRALGLNEARRTLHALADVKKKSRAWAR